MTRPAAALPSDAYPLLACRCRCAVNHPSSPMVCTDPALAYWAGRLDRVDDVPMCGPCRDATLLDPGDV